MFFEILICSLSIAFSVVGSFTFWKVSNWLDFYKPIVLLIGGYIAITLLVLLIVYLLSLRFNPKKPLDKPSKFARFVLQHAEQYIAFHARVKVKVIGKEKIPFNQRFVIVCNHRGNFDPMIITQIFGKLDITFITKESNFKIPIAKHYIAGCAYMGIDRNDLLQSLSVMKKSAKMIDDNISSIGVFPEGKRQTEEIIGEFHEGVFNIAIKSSAPLIVATIFDAHQIPKNFPFRRTHVTLNILKVIQNDELKTKTAKQVSDEVREMMIKDLSKYFTK